MRTNNNANDDSIKIYYDHVKNIQLLTADDERELSIRIQAGDEQARSSLIEANLRLVIKIARAYSNFEMPLIDLIQEGNMGLIKAAERFDYRRNVRFSTYASWWIKQAITRSLVNSRRTIRLPHRKEELLRHIHKAYGVLLQSLGREPNFAEIAKELYVGEAEVREALEMSGTMISLESDSDDEDSVSIVDIFEDNTYSPDAQFMRTCLQERTAAMLESLMDKERQVLMARFEFFGAGKNTLKDLGESMGISAETVRQIEKRAIRKLRENSEELTAYM